MLSDSLARRMTIGLFSAMIAASSSAVSSSSVARHDALDGAEREQLLRGDHRAGEEHRAQLVLRHEAREVRGDAERAAVDLGEAEGRVVGGDDDVGVARRARRRRRGRSRAPPRSPAPRSRRPRRTPRSSRGSRRRALSCVGSAASSLMSTPAWKPLPSARRITTRTSRSRPAARSASASWNQPATGQRVHGRVVDGDDRDVLARFRADHAREHTSGRDRGREPEPVERDAAGRAIAVDRGRARRRHRRRRRDRRRGLHRTLDRVRAASGPIRRCASWCASARRSASVHRAATAAGARRSSRAAAPRPRARHGRDAVVAMQRAMFATVDEIERVVADEEIECDWARGGTVQVATLPAHLARLRARARRPSRVGIRRRRLPRALAGRARATLIGCRPNLGALFTPHCAAIHPAKLVHGLARAVERLRSDDLRAHAGRRRSSPAGCARRAAPCAPRSSCARPRRSARSCPGSRRAIAPVYSLMIATEPLPDAFWAEARLATRPTFADFRHMIIYGQRTADGRFAFGGRGTPYHFGSQVRPQFDLDPRVFAVAARDAALAVPGARRRRDHAPVGWRGRRAARLVPVGRLRPRGRASRGRAATSATA